MKIDIWSDIGCPFCYIGTRQLDKALEHFAHRDSVKVIHHSFQLDPNAPREADPNLNNMLAKKMGVSPEQADTINQQAAKMFEDNGLTMNYKQAKAVNTFDAHRLIHFATENGKQDEVVQRLFKAFFADGKSVADTDTLVELAGEVGLDKKKAKQMLQSDKYADEVRADISQARQYGISGVPFFILDDKYGISGAQGVEVFSEALQKSWHETHPLTTLGDQSANVCADGVCLPTARESS